MHQSRFIESEIACAVKQGSLMRELAVALARSRGGEASSIASPR